MQQKNKTENKALKASEILSIPSIRGNALANHILSKFTNGNSLDFNRLTATLEAFLNSEELETKLKLIFSIYDIDDDGFISSLELFQLLKILNRGVLADRKLQNIVDRTFADTGEYKTKMNFEDFKGLVMKRNDNMAELLGCKSK